MKKIVIFAAIMFIVAPVFAFALAVPVQAQPELDLGTSFVEDGIALGDADPRTMAARIINVMLGFLGIIAVVIILAGGFKWMTAGGSEDKTDEAKKLITAGVIGLIIILASWAIASFVITQLVDVTTTA